MPYKYLEDVGTADIAFEATGRDLPQLFTAAADATLNVMIENIEAIDPREMRRVELENDKRSSFTLKMPSGSYCAFATRKSTRKKAPIF